MQLKSFTWFYIHLTSTVCLGVHDETHTCLTLAIGTVYHDYTLECLECLGHSSAAAPIGFNSKHV